MDICYSLRLECEIKQNGFRTILLHAMWSVGMKRLNVYRSKSLLFFITDQNIPGISHGYWKVLNRGSKAIKRDNTRGQIVADSGSKTKKGDLGLQGRARG